MTARSAGSLAAILLAAAAAAAEPPKLPDTKGWVEVRTSGFTVYSNAREKKAVKMAIDLERFREVLGLVTKGFDFETSRPTSVFAFKNDFTMLPYKLDGSGEPLNVGGYFMERPLRNYIALDLSAGLERNRVIYHEYVHSLLHKTFGRLPTWLDEGMAEYYSTFKFNEISNTAWVGTSIEGHVRQLRSSKPMDLDRLFAVTRRSPEYNEAEKQGPFYAQSWMLVHYLIDDEQRRAGFGRYLAQLRGGAAISLPEALGTDVAGLQRGLAEYMARGSGGFQITLADDVERAAPEAAPLAEADVLLHLGDLLSQRGPGQAPAARRHLDAALEGGAAKGLTFAMLGRVANQTDEAHQAETWFRKALQEDPDNEIALVGLGKVLLHQGWGDLDFDYEDDEPSAPVREARALFRRALERNRSNFEAMADMGRTYLFQAGDAELGMRLLAGAATLQPDRLDFVVDLVRLMARSGQREGAWIVIQQQLVAGDATPEMIGIAERWALLAEMKELEAIVDAGDEARAARMLDNLLGRIHTEELAGWIKELRAQYAEGESE